MGISKFWGVSKGQASETGSLFDALQFNASIDKFITTTPHGHSPMAAPPQKKPSPPKPATASPADDGPEFVPYISDRQNIPELTIMPVIVGVVLGIVFGDSSLYLVLKVGMTVSASIPVAVLSITVFRLFSKIFRVRQATILENNIVQTTGSAGESIAFGVAVTMPALMLLGFEMSLVRVTVVAVLGGLLGIFMMIPFAGPYCSTTWQASLP